MSGMNFSDPNFYSYKPALTNNVSRVSMPIKVSSAAMPSVLMKTAPVVEKGMTIFDAAKTSANTLKAEKVYANTAKVCGVTANVAKTVKKASGRLTFTQAMKRFKFSGKAKIFGAAAALCLVSASALGIMD